MPKNVIERPIPGAGKLSTADLKAVAQKSCGVLAKMGPKIQGRLPRRSRLPCADGDRPDDIRMRPRRASRPRAMTMEQR